MLKIDTNHAIFRYNKKANRAVSCPKLENKTKQNNLMIDKNTASAIFSMASSRISFTKRASVYSDDFEAIESDAKERFKDIQADAYDIIQRMEQNTIGVMELYYDKEDALKNKFFRLGSNLRYTKEKAEGDDSTVIKIYEGESLRLEAEIVPAKHLKIKDFLYKDVLYDVYEYDSSTRTKTFYDGVQEDDSNSNAKTFQAEAIYTFNSANELIKFDEGYCKTTDAKGNSTLAIKKRYEPDCDLGFVQYSEDIYQKRVDHINYKGFSGSFFI